MWKTYIKLFACKIIFCRKNACASNNHSLINICIFINICFLLHNHKWTWRTVDFFSMSNDSSFSLHQESLRPLNRVCVRGIPSRSLLHSATSTRRVVVYWRVEWRRQRSPGTSKTHRHTLAYANKFYSALLCREPTRDGYCALSSFLSPRLHHIS